MLTETERTLITELQLKLRVLRLLSNTLREEADAIHDQLLHLDEQCLDRIYGQ